MNDDLRAAVAAVRPVDSLAVPLGPGAPGDFLHALGNDTPEDFFTALTVFGALLPDLYAVFMRRGVHLKSGFFGPAERFLRDACNLATMRDIEFFYKKFNIIIHLFNNLIFL